MQHAVFHQFLEEKQVCVTRVSASQGDQTKCADVFMLQAPSCIDTPLRTYSPDDASRSAQLESSRG